MARNCMFYSEGNDMGATIPFCDFENSSDWNCCKYFKLKGSTQELCPHYISRKDGLETLRKSFIEEAEAHDIRPGVFLLHKDNKDEIALCMKTYPSLNTMDVMLENGECYESARIDHYIPTMYTAEAALDQLFKVFNVAKKLLKKEAEE